MANEVLGRTLRPAKRPRAASQLKSLIWLRRSLVQQLQGQQAQEGTGSRDHLRAGIVRLLDQLIEPDASQQGQEEEDPRDPSPHPAALGEVELMPIGDLGRLGLGVGRRDGRGGGTSESRGREKGGGPPS